MQERKTPDRTEPPYQLSLHIRHPSADPRAISRELQLSAVESFRAGDPRASRSGIAATAHHSETYWAAVIDPVTWSLPAMLPVTQRPRTAREQAGPAAALPPDRHERLRALIALARDQGFLNREQILEYLPDAVVPSAQLPAVISTLKDLGIAVAGHPAGSASPLLAGPAPQEARVLRMRFGTGPEQPLAERPFTVGWALWLTCACLATRHGRYLKELSGQGGSLTLLVAFTPPALTGFSVVPDMARQIAELGLTIRFELLEGRAPDPDR